MFPFFQSPKIWILDQNFKRQWLLQRVVAGSARRVVVRLTSPEPGVTLHMFQTVFFLAAGIYWIGNTVFICKFFLWGSVRHLELRS